MPRLRLILWAACLTSACVSAQRTPPSSSPSTPLPGPQGGGSQPPAPTAAPTLYSLDEALTDALSAPLQYIGTGPWQGIQRSFACAYQNGRVIVVDVYCSIKEGKAVRFDFFSPTRGRARLYAEASRPISQLSRGDYFSFMGEAQLAPLRREHLPPMRFTMSMAELSDYEHQRYEKFLPTCYGGMEHNRPQGGCLGELAPQARRWRRINQPFLDQPPPQWYQLITQLRALAVEHGRDP